MAESTVLSTQQALNYVCNNNKEREYYYSVYYYQSHQHVTEHDLMQYLHSTKSWSTWPSCRFKISRHIMKMTSNGALSSLAKINGKPRILWKLKRNLDKWAQRTWSEHQLYPTSCEIWGRRHGVSREWW